jgi:hypothetical protein
LDAEREAAEAKQKADEEKERQDRITELQSQATRSEDEEDELQALLHPPVDDDDDVVDDDNDDNDDEEEQTPEEEQADEFMNSANEAVAEEQEQEAEEVSEEQREEEHVEEEEPSTPEPEPEQFTASQAVSEPVSPTTPEQFTASKSVSQPEPESFTEVEEQQKENRIQEATYPLHEAFKERWGVSVEEANELIQQHGLDKWDEETWTNKALPPQAQYITQDVEIVKAREGLTGGKNVGYGRQMSKQMGLSESQRPLANHVRELQRRRAMAQTVKILPAQERPVLLREQSQAATIGTSGMGLPRHGGDKPIKKDSDWYYPKAAFSQGGLTSGEQEGSGFSHHAGQYSASF